MLAILLPLGAMFVMWLRIHTKHTTQSQVHVKQYFQDKSAIDIARYQVLADNKAFGGSTWKSGTTKTVKIKVDEDTTVDVVIEHRGFDVMNPSATVW